MPCKLLVPKDQIAKKFLAWANSAEGKAIIEKSNSDAKKYIADYRNARNVSYDLLHRRVTI